MKTIIGHLKNIIGKLFAKDEEGNLREVHSGDPIYSGEIIVDVRGEKIHDAIRAVKEDIADQSAKEGNVEADLKDDEFDKKDPKSKDYKSTTSTDDIDSAGEEANVDSSLRAADFYRENVGLTREEDGGERNVDAPLREANFSGPDAHIFSSGAGASKGDEVNVDNPSTPLLVTVPPVETVLSTEVELPLVITPPPTVPVVEKVIIKLIALDESGNPILDIKCPSRL